VWYAIHHGRFHVNATTVPAIVRRVMQIVTEIPKMGQRLKYAMMKTIVVNAGTSALTGARVQKVPANAVSI